MQSFSQTFFEGKKKDAGYSFIAEVRRSYLFFSFLLFFFCLVLFFPHISFSFLLFVKERLMPLEDRFISRRTRGLRESVALCHLVIVVSRQSLQNANSYKRLVIYVPFLHIYYR